MQTLWRGCNHCRRKPILRSPWNLHPSGNCVRLPWLFAELVGYKLCTSGLNSDCVQFSQQGSEVAHGVKTASRFLSKLTEARGPPLKVLLSPGLLRNKLVSAKCKNKNHSFYLRNNRRLLSELPAVRKVTTKQSIE